MHDEQVPKKLDLLTKLFAANLAATILLGAIVSFGMLSKAERGILALERAETRIQGLTDKVEPIMTAGAGRTVETLQKVNAGKLAEKTTEGASKVIDTAAEMSVVGRQISVLHPMSSFQYSSKLLNSDR